jgi:hypothetical protein
MGVGLWGSSAVPHTGWNCVNMYYVEEDGCICQMCQKQEIHNVHVMHHDYYHEELHVGCICAGRMEENLIRAQDREKKLKRVRRRVKKNMLKEWRISKSGNPYIKIGDVLLTVFRKNGYHRIVAKETNHEVSRFLDDDFQSEGEAKEAAFFFLEKLKSEDEYFSE